MKVFLGGTMNDSTWRDKLISGLKIWDEKAQLNEIKEKEVCDFLLFVITPLMTGVYSIAEVVDASNKTPKKTILCVMESDDGKEWTNSQRLSLNAVENLVHSNGAFVFKSLNETVSFLNQQI